MRIVNRHETDVIYAVSKFITISFPMGLTQNLFPILLEGL